MSPPVQMNASLGPVRPPIEEGGRLQVLVVAGEGGGSGGTALLHHVSQWADGARLAVEAAPDLPRAVRQLGGRRWDVVLAVLGERPDDDLAWWVDALRAANGSPRLIAVATTPSMGLVLRAQKLGVLDLLSLPLGREDLMRALERLRSAVTETAVALPEVEHHAVGQYALVGQSAAMLEVYKLIAQVAASTATVLIQGESGTGKEVVARAIHLYGPKAAGAFVAVNCAAIPENLLESELFGHEKGAFTGAVTRKIGRFEHATGGTLFLDEIADMSLALQAKILRAVQEREIERVGGTDTIPIDVRLIAATNRDLKDAIKQGRFREDLYYRLAVVPIRLPTLAERGDDLLLLTAFFIRQFAERYGKQLRAITDRALDLLRGHAWVGNVRELRNVIERGVIVATDATLRAEHLPDEIRGEEATRTDRPQGGLHSLAEVEARHIARVLAHTQGQIGTAAEILGIHRNTLTRKMKEYGL
ncbi:MAG TPA: sigma-54 dependent transcriptional regulator [Gemmatimonadales bacterium]|nr:sigma-54 dependent transcriptional regulator [Gemmatimonadales bacterium]